MKHAENNAEALAELKSVKLETEDRGMYRIGERMTAEIAEFTGAGNER